MLVYIVIASFAAVSSPAELNVPVLPAGVYATEGLCRFVGIPKARSIPAFREDKLVCLSFPVKDTK